ncbi:hypothetical protein MF628_000921 [Paenibacillus polymyxa]|uniref:hypothetical protein n=1 Tax=Paenibacillus polymyxa TaxID=1406 RepID=UPI00202551E1|nr:hypothetical protein [Paenibacillus polymyxa]URJ46391.1 hypothetical protein MF628_000921 [Paenibacillus polymyxa]
MFQAMENDQIREALGLNNEYQEWLKELSRVGGSITTDPDTGLVSIEIGGESATFAMKESMTGDNVVKIIDGKPPDSPQ